MWKKERKNVAHIKRKVNENVFNQFSGIRAIKRIKQLTKYIIGRNHKLKWSFSYIRM